MPNKTHTRKRSRGKNFVAIPFSAAITLGTLGVGTVINAGMLGASLGEDLFCISVDINWALRGFTAAEGPISVGVAHSDYSVGEIGENLDAELTDPDDKIQQERARRLVRRSGMFPGLASNEVLNQGTPLRTTMKFSVGDTFNPSIWARNLGPSALTTGAIVQLDGTLYGRWQR